MQSLALEPENHRRAHGCILGLMVGDALGAGVEGWPPSEIARLARLTWGSDLVEGFFDAVHMGTYVTSGEPGQYREAREVKDSSFVPTGPPSNSNTAQIARRGMYTDDTNQSLALGESILTNRGVIAEEVAKSYSSFFSYSPYRGYPPSSKAVMKAIAQGADVNSTGLPPIFPFPGGSFANGGAMKISLLALAYRQASDANFRAAVENAIRCSHRHPEAIDFAVVQATAVKYALACNPAAFDPQDLLVKLQSPSVCSTDVMKTVLQDLAAALVREVDNIRDAGGNCNDSSDHGGDAKNDYNIVKSIVSKIRRPGSGMEFQIASVHMMPCVLYIVGTYHAHPLRAIQMAIALGGDTDTTACMVGAVLGALQGPEWAAPLAKELENGPRGRDYGLSLAGNLWKLNLGRH